MNFKSFSAIIIASIFLLFAFAPVKQVDENQQNESINVQTWAERLGYPEGKKVIMLHADDAGVVEGHEFGGGG